MHVCLKPHHLCCRALWLEGAYNDGLDQEWAGRTRAGLWRAETQRSEENSLAFSRHLSSPPQGFRIPSGIRTTSSRITRLLGSPAHAVRLVIAWRDRLTYILRKRILNQQREGGWISWSEALLTRMRWFFKQQDVTNGPSLKRVCDGFRYNLRLYSILYVWFSNLMFFW